jgi:hypothetical protein
MTVADAFKDLVVQKNQEVDEAHSVFLTADAKAKKLKKQWEGAVAVLQQTIRDAASGQGHLPYGDDNDGDGPDGGDGDGGDDDDSGPIAPVPPSGDEIIDVDFTLKQLPAPDAKPELQIPAPAAKPVDSEAWRIAPVAGLVKFGLARSVINKLEDIGLKTINDLAVWSNAGKLLQDIPGIGEAKATELENALDSFWIDWNHRQAAVPAPKPVEEPDELIIEPAENPKPKRTRKKKAG